MRSFITTAVTAALLLTPAYAQTWSDCNPTKKSCPADVGLKSKHYEVDFTKAGKKGLARWEETAKGVTFGERGANFVIHKRGDAPTVQTNFYIHFGHVEVTMLAAPGQGVISSFVMESDDLDEIDWEWVGSDHVNGQSNFFGKGNTTTYDRGAYHALRSSPQYEKHTYAVDWTHERIQWIVNGKVVRTVHYHDSLAVFGKNYPQTPMNIRLGIWAGGDKSNSPGTIEWAGGPIRYEDGPYGMHVQKVKITNYNPASGYKYKNKSGSYKSIKELKKTPKKHTRGERTHAPQVERRGEPEPAILHPREAATDKPTPRPSNPVSITSTPTFWPGTDSTSTSLSTPTFTTWWPGTTVPITTGTTSETSSTSKTSETSKTSSTSKTTKTTETSSPTDSSSSSGPSNTQSQSSQSSAPSQTPDNAGAAVIPKIGGAAAGLLGALAML